MIFHSIIHDNCLENIDDINNRLRSMDYTGQEGPDGVLYPNIAKLPEDIESEFHQAIEESVGFHIEPVLSFARLSIQGDSPPHWAHNDAAIASYTALLYLNTNPSAGTVLVTHKKTGINSGPLSESMVKLWKEDTNDLSKWNIDFLCPMKYNRLLVLDSQMFHASLPFGGFGSSSKDGRLVVICFFNKRR